MPFVDLTLYGVAPDAAQTAALHAGLTRLMAGPLRKNPALTVIALHAWPAAAVAIGAAPLPAGAWTGRLVARITAGTNRPGEIERFLAEAQALLAAVLGPPASPLYLVVDELPATAWGYDGLTQQARSAASVAP